MTGQRRVVGSELIDFQKWQKIQDNFFAVTGIAVRCVDAQGELITFPSGQVRFCRQVMDKAALKNETCGRCLPTFLGGKGVVDRNLAFSCKGGMHNFLAPLQFEGKVIGYLSVGPVILVMRKAKEEYLAIAEELGLDREEFWNALLEIKVVSFNGIQSLVELIKDVAECTCSPVSQPADAHRKLGMITEDGKIKRIFEVLLDTAFQVIGADIGSIMLLDRENQQLRICAARGLADDIVRNTCVGVNQGLSGLAIKEKASFLIDHSVSDNRIKPFLTRMSISSSMIVPIFVKEEIIGVMNLATLEQSVMRFTVSNLQQLIKLVELASIAVPS